MTEQDEAEGESSGGLVQNAATTRCLLALRYVLFADEGTRAGKMPEDFRIVAQLTRALTNAAGDWLKLTSPPMPSCATRSKVGISITSRTPNVRLNRRRMRPSTVRAGSWHCPPSAVRRKVMLFSTTAK